MLQRIKIFMLLAAMIVTAGQASARLREYLGTIAYTQGANDGGTLTFYKDASCSNAININSTTHKSDKLRSNDFTERTVYIKAVPDGIHTFGAADNDGKVTFIQVEKTISMDAVQARRRTSGDNNLGLGDFIAVTAVSGKNGIYCFTMPDDENVNVTVTAEFVAKPTNTAAISYIDASGETQSKAAGSVYILDGTEFTLGDSGSETWYVVPDGVVAYSWTLTLYGDVHLILADNSKMTVGTKNSPIAGNAISGDHALSIYSQGGQDNKSEGKLTAYATNSGINIGDSKNLTINGGQVTATVTGLYGIYANGDVTINGGQVTATGVNGIYSYAGDITLGWTSATDYIKASTYNVSSGKAVKIADGQVLKFVVYNPNGIVKLMGTLSNDDITLISDVKLMPYGYGGYCGQTVDNSDKNLTWEIPLVNGQLSNTLSIQKNNNVTNSSNFTMAGYNTNSIAPWIKPTADGGFGGQKYPFTAVTIGNGVTTIGQNAFQTCTGLTSVTIGNSVTIICFSAFESCTGLTAVTIPASVTTIDPGAFRKCSGLTTVTLNRYVPSDEYTPITALYYNGTAFNGCDNLKLILVPNEDAYTSYYSNTNWQAYKAKLAPQTFSVAKNQSGWSTYCHGYPVSYNLSEGVTANEVTGLSQDGKSVTIAQADNNLVAPRTPLLLNYSGEGNITLTAQPTTATTFTSTDALVSTTGTDVVFYGNASRDAIAAADLANYVFAYGSTAGKQSYILRSGDFIIVDEIANAGIAAHRCWLTIGSSTSNARKLSISNEPTGISEELIVKSEEFAAATGWYTIDGRKLNGKPTKKGLYIHNGVKTVIK